MVGYMDQVILTIYGLSLNYLFGHLALSPICEQLSRQHTANWAGGTQYTANWAGGTQYTANWAGGTQYTANWAGGTQYTELTTEHRSSYGEPLAHCAEDRTPLGVRCAKLNLKSCLDTLFQRTVISLSK